MTTSCSINRAMVALTALASVAVGTGNADATMQTRAIKRHEQPEDLVGACVFLASTESDFVTGQTLVVDGGSAMW